MLHYNYVFFAGGNNLNRNKTQKDYLSISLRDLEKTSYTRVVYMPLDYACYPVRLFSFIYRSRRVAKYFKFPQKLLYPFYFKNDFKNDFPLCFIILDRWHITGDYLNYLKNKYPDAKFVLLFRDLYEVSCSQNNAKGLMDSKVFDLKMTYDSGEAEKYGMSSFDEFQSKVDVEITQQEPQVDVFFAGFVKDRLPNLLAAYDIFEKAGLTVSYYLTGVDAKNRVNLPGIEYAEKPLSYSEMLYRTVNSKCVLEILQGGAVGFTSRYLESVMYNKKLITNNTAIVNEKFYNPHYIQVVNSVKEIDPSFVLRNDITVDYHYNGEFSPTHLIEQIDKELTGNARR